MDFVDQVFAYVGLHGAEFAVRASVALVILVVGYIVARIASRLAGTAVSRSHNPRAATLQPIVRALVFIGLLFFTTAMSLDHLGVDVATLLAGAGVLGLAIGFGAQTLVKDCLSGFFLILDDVLSQGDFVELDGVSGHVEAVGLRVTQVRAFSGQLWYIPNGQISRVGNWNRGWARAVVEVGLAYEQDMARGLEVLGSVGEAWAGEHEEMVLEPAEAQGALSFADSSVLVRLVVKFDNSETSVWAVERELRARIKTAFDEAGVEIPFPRTVVYRRDEEPESVVDAA